MFSAGPSSLSKSNWEVQEMVLCRNSWDKFRFTFKFRYICTLRSVTGIGIEKEEGLL